MLIYFYQQTTRWIENEYTSRHSVELLERHIKLLQQQQQQQTTEIEAELKVNKVPSHIQEILNVAHDDQKSLELSATDAVVTGQGGQEQI